MITDIQKQIAETESKLADLQKKKDIELQKQLGNLHTSLGFSSRDELIAALKSAGPSTGAKRGPKPKAAKAGKAPKAAAAPKAPKAKKSAKKAGKRARITPEVRAQVVEALKAGGKGGAVAAQFGISLPSLQNIKKDAGLTKSRK